MFGQKPSGLQGKRAFGVTQIFNFYSLRMGNPMWLGFVLHGATDFSIVQFLIWMLAFKVF